MEQEDRMSRCRSCGAEIIWIKMMSGKAMPVNAQPVQYWEKRGAAGKVVTPEGEVVSCEFTGDERTDPKMGYISHFSTCPNANKHRKGSK